MGTERIRTLLHSHKDRFVRQLKEAMNRGWADWAKQATELHTFRVDKENRRKEGKSFYKLDEGSIATVLEHLTSDYQALADHHSEEIVQLLEEFGATEVEIVGRTG